MNRVYIIFFTLLIPFLSIGQKTKVSEGVPPDLNASKLIILKHATISTGSEAEDKRTRKYVIQRQENHNRISEEFNKELEEAAKKYYPFEYILAFPSEIDSLMKLGYKYVLFSNVYDYEHLADQPPEGELLVFGYYIKDQELKNVFTLYEIDEMKVYDAKMMIRKLNKEAKKAFPEAY